MELNSEIWGTSEQQTGQISNISAVYGVFKSSLSTCDTIRHYAENNGKLEPIDESVNYWQIADDSMFNHYVFIRRDGNNRHIYEPVKNIKPKSIFLVMRPPVGNNLIFDFSNASCPIWSSSVGSNLPYNNYGDIITTFNYNGICARYLLNCFKKDGDGNPTGVVTSFSVYDYFNSDENGEPIKDQYIIVAISSDIFAVQSNGSNAYNVNHVFYPVSSTPVSTPTPNYYYTDNDYIAYNRTTTLIGHNVLSSNNGYGTQQGAFGQNGNAAWYTFDSRYWEIRNFLNSSNQYIEYFAFTGTYEDMLRQLSTLGFWFKEDLTRGSVISPLIILGENCTDDKCIMPEIINGRTTGNYKRGTVAAADPQAAWGNQWRENVNYTGDKPYKNEESSTTPFMNSLKISSFSNIYMLKADNIYGLAEELKTYVSGETYNPNYFFGQNPIDCIAMLRIYPFNMLRMQCAFEVENFDWITSFEPIKIGEWVSENSYGIAVKNIKTDGNDEYTLWEYTDTIAGRYGDFRDYEPYSSYDIYLPFCGTTNIDPKVFLNRPLTIRYTLDGLSGLLTVYILVDGKIYKSVSGNCAIDIPVSGYKISDYIENMYNLSTGQAIAKNESLNALLSMVTGTGNAVMAQGINAKHSSSEMVLAGAIIQAVGNVGTAINNHDSSMVKRLSYQHHIDCSAPQPAFVQSGKGLDSWSAPMGIYILAKTCEMLPYNEEVYSKTTGHACCIYSTLGSQHENDKDNLVQVNDIILDGIELTEMEKRNLLSLLQSGVII